MKYETLDSGELRTFATGATRDTAEGKLEPWGFTSALVTKRFSEYMDFHRMQSDGNLRASDNWKKGIPFDAYKHSLSRHVEDLKLILEGYPEEANEPVLETVLCSILFNVQGMLDTVIKDRLAHSDEGRVEADPELQRLNGFFNINGWEAYRDKDGLIMWRRLDNHPGSR